MQKKGVSIDSVEQAILLWNIIYSFIGKMRIKHPEWLYIRHEDLSTDPLGYFKKEFDNKIKDKIKMFSDSSNPAEAENGIAHQLKRNSYENIKNWQHRLDINEIDKIKEKTQNVYSEFYSYNDW